MLTTCRIRPRLDFSLEDPQVSSSTLECFSHPQGFLLRALLHKSHAHKPSSQSLLVGELTSGQKGFR